MTSQPEPAPSDAPQASQVTKPLRELIALVLLGANALFLFTDLIRLVVPDSRGFTDRARDTAGDFIGITSTVLPLLAVLLATHIQPAVGRARLITLGALGEYAVSTFFAVITVFPVLIDTLAGARFRAFIVTVLVHTGLGALFGVAAFLVFRIWRHLYYVPKPNPQPGLYGQPQPYGQPGHPQPGYPAAPGQPGGYPGAGFPHVPTQPTTYASPTAYGQPAGAGAGYAPPGYGAASPAPAPPASAVPPSTPAAPPTEPDDAERTRKISLGGGPDATERTQRINPASQQPSAGSQPPRADADDDPTTGL